MVTANNIDANERARMLYKIESEHRIQQNRIDTTETYKLEDDFDRELIKYESKSRNLNLKKILQK
jgi:hypothetical protein